MRINLGSAPWDEPCTQFKRDGEYVVKMLRECSIYKHQLQRTYGAPPGNAEFVIRSEYTDYGTTWEVVIVFDQEDDRESAFAEMVEGTLPSKWDEEAKLEFLEEDSYESLKAKLPNKTNFDW